MYKYHRIPVSGVAMFCKNLTDKVSTKKQSSTYNICGKSW